MEASLSLLHVENGAGGTDGADPPKGVGREMTSEGAGSADGCIASPRTLEEGMKITSLVRSPMLCLVSAWIGLAGPGVGSELWRSDGTAAETFRLTDIGPGPAGSNLAAWTVAGGSRNRQPAEDPFLAPISLYPIGGLS